MSAILLSSFSGYVQLQELVSGRVFSNHACLRMLMFPLGLHFVLGLLLGAELCLGTEAHVQMIPDAPETFLSSLPILFSFWCRFYF